MNNIKRADRSIFIENDKNSPSNLVLLIDL